MDPIGQVNVSKYNSMQQLHINKNKNVTHIRYKEKITQTSFNEKIDISDFDKIREQSENDIEAFEKFINKILSYQGNYTLRKSSQKIKVDIKIKTKGDPKETQKTKSPEIKGYWGAEETSKRILDFAKKISNDDPSKLDLLVDAFKKGFEEAEEIFGGTLPDVSYKTYDLVMEGFDEMRNPSTEETE